MSTFQPVQVPTEDRHFIAVDQALLEPQPLDGFADAPFAHAWCIHHQISKDTYRVIKLPGSTGYIAALVAEGDEDTARTSYGDRAVDTYFEEVEGLNVFAATVDIDELKRQLDQIGEDVQRLAESIGIPDPGAAKAEDLLREMWGKIHAHDARQYAEHGLAVNESRMVG